MKNALPIKTVLLTLSVAMMSFASADCISDSLSKYANGDHRADGYAARNSSRNPVETLTFFGITPTMTVVEISPGGGGWYTEILAPFLRESGTYYAGSFDPDSESEYSQRNFKRYSEKLAANPEMYDKIKVNVFDPGGKMAAAPEGSADMVLTFRNTHGWARDGNAQKAISAMYSYLKPGGILGIVQHRGHEGTEYDGKTGYLAESQVIGMAEDAGFVLLDKSEINANPKDTKNHPSGVWSLPPGLRLDGHEDKKAMMEAIGESDRMTLKFMRPVMKPDL